MKSRLKKLITKKYLIIISAFIIINLLFLNFYVSYAYYHTSSSFNITKSKVGNIYYEKYDYSILFYEEDSNKKNSYNLVNEIPDNNYSYNYYKCKNNSNIIYDEQNKIVSIISSTKDLCSIYFTKNGE